MRRIEKRISRMDSDVFLPSDFSDLGGEDQVLRALRTAVRSQKLVRLGYGVYARARRSSLTGEVVLDTDNGFLGATRQALEKLGIAWSPGAAEESYNRGESTQIPVNPVVRVKGRFGRKLSYRGRELVIEQRTAR